MNMSLSTQDDYDVGADDFDFDTFDNDGQGELDFEGDMDEFGWAAPLGGILGSAGAGGAYDWAEKKLLDSKGKGTGKKSTARRIGQWMKDTNWARDLATGTGAALGTALGALIPEDADQLEPEFSSEDIDAMEALAEEALEAEGDAEAMEASDQIVARSFGIARASATLRRRILPALARKVRMIIARARRDPRYRVMAKVAPLALRRTAVTLLRMAMQRRPVTSQVAQQVFNRTLSILLRQKTLRNAALRNSARRRRRYYARSGRPRPVIRSRRSPARGRRTSQYASSFR